MKAANFAYRRPASLSEALGLLATHGAEGKLLAGGQSLLPALNLRLSAPAMLIDIGRLPELRGITLHDDRLRIGALTRHDEVLASPDIARHAPLLPLAMAHVAHPAIRSRGTFGGSLANADPAAELPACALALDATVLLESPRGPRRVAAQHFFRGLFETAIAPDEILVAAEFPIASPDSWCGFQELARRSGDYAMVGLAACGEQAGGQRVGASFTALRLAWFGVGVIPTLAQHTAQALLSGATPTEAAAQLACDLTPHDDLQASAAMRLHLAGILLRRVLPPHLATAA